MWIIGGRDRGGTMESTRPTTSQLTYIGAGHNHNRVSPSDQSPSDQINGKSLLRTSKNAGWARGNSMRGLKVLEFRCAEFWAFRLTKRRFCISFNSAYGRDRKIQVFALTLYDGDHLIMFDMFHDEYIYI